MATTPRDITRQCLRFEHPPRLPRHTWTLPWAEARYPDELAQLRARFPDDIVTAPDVYLPSPRVRGDQHAVGASTDEWSCVFDNRQDGVIGQVHDPILKDLANWRTVEPPYETLPTDRQVMRDTVNRFCANTDRFVLTACFPRPWERYQFLRGSENAFMDMAMPGGDCVSLLNKIHEFYLAEFERWVRTDVDGIVFIDDWGSQQALLIDPATWRELFKPLYRDYCDLARSHDKFVFMHSDGNIQSIYPDLVEIGVSAVNSQLGTMDMADLAKTVKGRITFWGEIDRQHVLIADDPQEARDAVREIAGQLYDPSGGVIAQYEFGLGINPVNAFAVYDEWDRVQSEAAGTRSHANQEQPI